MIFLSICLFHCGCSDIHVPFSSLTKLPETNRRMTKKKREIWKRGGAVQEIESRHQNLKFKTGETSNLGKETAGPLCRELASAIEKGPGGKKKKSIFRISLWNKKGKEKILLSRTVLNNRNILEKGWKKLFCPGNFLRMKFSTICFDFCRGRALDSCGAASICMSI